MRVRPETEWVETVASGGNTLVDADAAAIDNTVPGTISGTEKPQLYGDGTAARKITERLSEVAEE